MSAPFAHPPRHNPLPAHIACRFPSRIERQSGILALPVFPACPPQQLGLELSPGGDHTAPPADPAHSPRATDQGRSAVPPEFASLPRAAWHRALARRADMIAQGHTPATDAAKGRGLLAHKARFYVDKGLEFLKSPRVDRDHAAYRHKLETAVAYLIAELDALDLRDQPEN